MGEPTNPAPAPELYPGHAEELRRHAERIKALERAAREPLPGPLLEVYASVPTTVAGFTIRPLVHYDFILLTRLGSPLIEHLRGTAAAKTAQTGFTDEQAYEMVWQFCRPCKVVAAELAAYETAARRECPDADADRINARVREQFKARALEEIGLSLGVVEAALLVKGVEREVARAFSTAISYAPRKAEGENFTPPPTAPTTGSVGGSITSPG
jgi:hypothetical protein